MANDKKEPIRLTFKKGTIKDDYNQPLDLEKLALAMVRTYIDRNQDTVDEDAFSIAAINKLDYYLILSAATRDIIATSSLSSVTGRWGPRIEGHTSLNIHTVNFYKKRE